MTEEQEAAATLHIVVFPWLAFGHMIPLLELSKSLAMKGHRVTFISTPRNLQRLPAVPPALTSLVEFVPFSLPQVDGLPPDAESTMDLLPHQVQFLKKAFDGLADAFSGFLERHASASAGKQPDWIVIDFAQYWAPPIASRFGVPCAYFSVFPASTLAFFGAPSEMKEGRSRTTPEDLAKTPNWISKIGANLAYRPFECPTVFMCFYAMNASGISDGHRFGLAMEGCKLIAPRSCFELESSWLHLLREMYKKAVVPVGLMPPELVDVGNKGAEVFDWLAQKPPRSVVYVALGSEVMISVELVHELALGLEQSEVPFLWALRRPATAAEEEADRLLPQGFEERVGSRGAVVMGWVPQLKVLAHPSVGGFLTHCGWSSIVEGLHVGHPLVMLPLAIDQGLNFQLLEKIGTEVTRDEKDGSFSREDVAKAVRQVMAEEEGKEYRRRAEELAATVFDKGTQERCFDDFVQSLKDYKGVEV